MRTVSVVLTVELMSDEGVRAYAHEAAVCDGFGLSGIRAYRPSIEFDAKARSLLIFGRNGYAE